MCICSIRAPKGVRRLPPSLVSNFSFLSVPPLLLSLLPSILFLMQHVGSGNIRSRPSPSPQSRYTLLPTTYSKEKVFRHVATLSSFRRRVCVACLALLLIIGGTISFYGLTELKTKISNIKYGYIQQKTFPPTFDRYYDMERAYPQHNASLPFPEGENGRFMWVSNPHWGMLFLSSAVSIV